MGNNLGGPWLRSHAVALLGCTSVVAYAVLGTLFVLVWNPLAAVPGVPLGEIYARLAAAQESLAAPWVISWAALGVLLALFVGFLQSRRPALTGRQAVTGYLTVLVLGAPSLWIASFPAGMSLADAFFISGGDHSPWGMILSGVSAAALLALGAVVVQGRRASAGAPARAGAGE